MPRNITSQNNNFRNIGNNFANDTSQIKPIITFNDFSCVSKDDYFDRQNTTATNSQIPWVSGNAPLLINQGSIIKSVVIQPGTVSTLCRIPLNSRSQGVKFEYKAVNTYMERSGKLEMNVSTVGTSYFPDGQSAVGDSYSYSEQVVGKSQLLMFSTDQTYSSLPLLCDANFSTYPYGYTTSDYSAGTSSIILTVVNPRGQNISSITTGLNVTAVTLPPTGLFPTSNDVGILAHDITGAFKNLSSTATAVSIAPLFSNQISITFNTSTAAVIPNGSVFVFSSSTLVTWYGPTTFNFLNSIDPYGNINALSLSDSLPVKLAINGSAAIYPITGTTYISTLSSYQLQFNVTTSTTIHPEDTIEVLIGGNNFLNYTLLVCQNNDSVATTVEYTLKSLSC